MRTSAAGRAAIESREGLRLTAYRDSVGVLTIGFGHTSAAGSPKVTDGLTITHEEASAVLGRDLAAYEEAVLRGLAVGVGQTEFDALVSFCFNVGPANFARSTVLRRLNRGDRSGAADALLAWNKAGGRVLPGLTKRRSAERAQFLSQAASTVESVSTAAAAPAEAPPSGEPARPATAPRRTGGILAALRRMTGRA